MPKLNKTIVDIGVPTSRNQLPAFWRSIMALDWGGGAMLTAEGALTDTNRNNIVDEFLFQRKDESEYLFFVDDDVEVPSHAIEQMLSWDKPFVAGIYYRRSPPCDPLIYRKREDGWYRSLLPEQDYETGDLIPIDACGMGCTLIHRSVFQQIIETHFLYRRHNKSFGFMHYSAVDEVEAKFEPGVHVSDGSAYLVQKMQPFSVELLGPKETLPFFALEYGRTEDFHFCELAKAAGVEIYADTGIECNHWGALPIGRTQHFQVRDWMDKNEVQNVDGIAIQEIKV